MNALAWVSEATAQEAKASDSAPLAKEQIVPPKRGIKDASVMAARRLHPKAAWVPASASWSKDILGEVISVGRANTNSKLISLEPLQEWEGYVTAIANECFTARLVDKTADKIVEEEIADFPLEEVRDVDQALLKEGAVFRWVIGYLRQASGMKMRASQIVFRRMPAWTKSELSKARVEAKQIADGIAWD